MGCVKRHKRKHIADCSRWHFEHDLRSYGISRQRDFAANGNVRIRKPHFFGLVKTQDRHRQYTNDCGRWINMDHEDNNKFVRSLFDHKIRSDEPAIWHSHSYKRRRCIYVGRTSFISICINYIYSDDHGGCLPRSGRSVLRSYYAAD